MRKPRIKRSRQSLFSLPNNDDPIVITIGDSLTSNLYKQVYISCPVFGLPKPNVVWKFNGKVITDVKNVEILNNGSLKISSVLWDHQGSFACYQANPVGIDSAYSKINVVGKSTIFFPITLKCILYCYLDLCNGRISFICCLYSM